MDDRGILTAADLKEVWVLEWDHGALVPPMDDCGADDVFVAFPNEEQANSGAFDTLANYADDDKQTVTPVRVFPTYQRGTSWTTQHVATCQLSS